ncbi:FAD-dependent oxidoreductase [Pseudomonas sp. PhalM4]
MTRSGSEHTFRTEKRTIWYVGEVCDPEGAHVTTQAAVKAVAIFGASSESLLYGYYLQRFGIDVDIYFPDRGASIPDSDHLTATWLCFNQEPQAMASAWRGLGELRDLTLDLGVRAVGPESGTIIFETRSEHVQALEQFANNCRSRGLLVDFSESARQMAMPFGTLASVRFLQDLSVYPKALSQKLGDAFRQRGGEILYGRSLNNLQPVQGRYQVALGELVRIYGTVIAEDTESHGVSRLGRAPADCPNSSMGITGRYLSFSRAIQFMQVQERQQGLRPATQVPDDSLVSVTRPSNCSFSVPSVLRISSSGDLAHWFSSARSIAEHIRQRIDQGEEGEGRRLFR